MLNVSYAMVGEKKFAMVPVKEMAVDSTYQRVIRNRIRKMIAEWDYEKCDVLTVSYRDNKYYVVDGQHRFMAAKANNVEYLPCQVLENMTQKDEAKKFVEMNTLVCKLSPFDTFSANLLLGDETDSTIANLAETYGLSIGEYKGIGNGQIGSIAICRRIVKKQGADCLNWVLRVLHEARWHEIKTGHSSRMMYMLFHFYANNKNDISFLTGNVISCLRKTNPSMLTANAKVMYPSLDNDTACERYFEWFVNATKEKKMAA